MTNLGKISRLNRYFIFRKDIKHKSKNLKFNTYKKYKMNNLKFIIFSLVLLILTISSCKKEDAKVFGCMVPSATNYNPSATDDNGTCRYEGNVTFWYNSNGSNATVFIGGKVGYINLYYPTYNPSCGSVGCANFTLPIGTYSFSASSSWSDWNGTVTITKNGCTLMLLQ